MTSSSSTSRRACCRFHPAPKPATPKTPCCDACANTSLRKLGHKTYVGMLHRLDRDTSGSLAVALRRTRTPRAASCSSTIASSGTTWRWCRAFPIRRRARFDARISSGYHDGRRKLVDEDAPASMLATDYRVRERLRNAALLELRLHTGRQHQIRLHLEKLGHPLIGERVYSRRTLGKPQPSKRNMLHAWTLAFPHPLTGDRIAVEAPLPADFRSHDQAPRRFLLADGCSFASPTLAQTTLSLAGRPQANDGDPGDLSRHHRRRPRRGGLAARSNRRPVSSRPIRSRASPPPKQTEVRVAFDKDYPLHRRPLPRLPIPPASSSTRSARTSCGRDQDTFEVLLDTFCRSPQRLRLLDQRARARRPTRRLPTRAATSTPTGTRCGGSQARRDRGGLDARSSGSRSRRCASKAGDGHDVGHQLRAPHPPQERGQLLVAGVARVLDLSRIVGRRPRPGLPALKPGRNLRIKPFVLDRRGARRRRRGFRRRLHGGRRLQGRRHAVADARRHRQSGLRPGRSRRAAGQPDAVQPVLSRRSASSSSRTPASSTSATSRATSAQVAPVSVRPKKTCCSSSAAASA